jgi:flagellar motor switch protein FliN/FliY
MSEASSRQAPDDQSPGPLSLAAGEPPLSQSAAGPDPLHLAGMLDIPLNLAVELGRAELTLGEVLALRPGGVVELDRLPGEPLNLYANGRLIARGEIIVVNEVFAFRVTDVTSAAPSRPEAG